MDLPKFIALVSHSALFFCRADRLGDPHEGATALDLVEEQADRLAANILQMDTVHAVHRVLPTLQSDISQTHGFMTSNFRDYVLVNCWYRSRYESDAMWKIYAPSGLGVAIKSTVRRLSESLCCDEQVFVGNVRYDDHRRPVHSNEIAKFLSKRKAFSHEKELRAISMVRLQSAADPMNIDTPAWWLDGEDGTDLCADINHLIMEIVIPPSAPDWYRDVVSHICSGAGLAKLVRQSEMSSFVSSVDVIWEARMLAARKVGTALNIELLPGGGAKWKKNA